jgi:hypothetical protein
MMAAAASASVVAVQKKPPPSSDYEGQYFHVAVFQLANGNPLHIDQ